MEKLNTTVIDYGNGIYAIDQQMVRAFLVVGEHTALLLDTGAIRVDIISYINEITNLPVKVILTHGDGDHIGNLQSFSTALIHKNDMAAVLSHEACEGVTLCPVEENDVIDIGGRKLKVIFTPGHTAGSVCLLDEENMILFAGDTVSYGPVFLFGERRNIQQYLKSLKLLKQMKENGVFKTVYCCHNTCPISADAVDELIQCVEGKIDGTLTATPAQMPVPTGDKPYICKYASCAILVDGEK